MAQLKKLIPFIIFWETGIKDQSLSNENLFAKAKAKGIVNDRDDRGGATLVGITIGTYREYCRRKKSGMTSSSVLKNLTYEEWLDILKTMFWDRWQADHIADQRVAEMLVDWVWTSGSYGITIPQQLLGVKADGIVGPKTLDAVNTRNPTELFESLKQERIAYIDRICASRPANLRFRTGWLRRINSL
ncbi:MAG: peptidoglycan domain protein [Muribaculaceae bacterium]|nr:peptidoglycan domain protein [Muribaculaceae bacterium]